jgi:benzoate-CoA ligase
MWVAPAEVENRLLAHPAVAQAVVVGARDTDGLDKTVAFVVPETGSQVTEDELIAFCRQALESFKRPRRVVFVDAFPMTATGKIRRVDLRATAEGLLAESARSTGFDHQ